MEKKTEFQVGIDFGTCNIKVARWNNKKKKPVRMHLDSNQDNSDYKIPNAIAYLETENGGIEKIVGDAAVDSLEPDNTIENIKYYLQQKDWSKYVPNLQRSVDIGNVLEDIFEYLKNIVKELNEGKEIDSAVITAPVCFSEVQKNKIVQAAANSGLPIKEIIAEPAAALFSLFDELDDKKENVILIFDFGGATLDLSLISVKQDTENTTIAVLASSGMLYGGLDINYDIYEKIFLKKYQSLETFLKNHARLAEMEKDFLHTVEKMKRAVSRDGFAKREWRPYTGEPFSIDLELENDEFVSMLKESGRDKAIIREISDLLEQAAKTKDSITHLAIIGGSARIPFFKDLVLMHLKNAVLIDIDEEDMYSAVSEGAVRYLHMLDVSNLEFTNKIPYSVGYENKDGEFKKVIPRGTRFGHRGRRTNVDTINGKINVYQTFSNNNKSKISEDETVIYMGYFDVKDIASSSEKLYAEFAIGKSGNLQLGICSGKQIVDTLELIMR